MKEKIEQFTRGEFEFHAPGIYLSVERIEEDVEAGRDYYGTLMVKNADEAGMKGLVYCASSRLYLEDTSFQGVENVISFVLKCEDLEQGEVLETQIEIVSSCGEIAVPVTIRIIPPFCNTTVGVVKDLFQFTNLAKEDWEQALALFLSDEFERVFLQQDPKSRLLYECVIPSTDHNVALDEFLNGVHKKVPVSLTVEQTKFDYVLSSQDSFSEVVTIRKESWGHVDVRVSSDCPFVMIEQEQVTMKNFIGNSYGLEFIVYPERMRAGRNYARITIATPKEQKVIEISCICHMDGYEQKKEREFLKSRELDLLTAYLDFRTNVISIGQYVSEMQGILSQMIEKNNGVSYEMLIAHSYILADRQEEALGYLESFQPFVEEWKETSALEYSMYEYLWALYTKENERILKAQKEVRELYENGHDSWQNLWFLLYLDKEYETNHTRKLSHIREQILAGAKSPVLYQEIISVYNEEPSLFCELDDMNIQVLNYGIRYDCISQEIASQFVYLASREKRFHPVIYRALSLLYDKYESSEILIAICTLLIKGHKTGEKYFAWYHLGVMAQLKITQLAESYLYSINEEENLTLPNEILLYFVYNSTLSEIKKSYLYAYIVNHKEEIPSIYRTYLKQMENFCIRQLSMHHINRNLAVLYEKLLHQELVTPVLASNLPHVVFRYEIQCENPNVKGVCVVHKELYEEKYVPLSQNSAVIDIYTENAQILLVDNDDNRYLSTDGYLLERFMNPDRFTDICYACHIDDPMILLHLSEKMERYQKATENAIEVREKVYRMPNLRPYYYKRCLMEIMKHSYNVMDNERLTLYLADMNLHNLKRTEQSELIEYAIIQGMTLRVYELIKEFGYERISLKRLFKFCTSIEAESDPFLTQLYFHVYRLGKYNETTLKYLDRNYNGLSKNMYELWKSGQEDRISMDEIEERTLAQMLFAESFQGDTFQMFRSYYTKNADSLVTKAFMTYYAYRYLVHDRVVPGEFFDILQKELVMEDNQLNRLASLKYLGKKERITQEEGRYAAHYLNHYIQQGFVLPFFQDYKDKIDLPIYVTDKYFVEYKTDPGKQVVIHYRMNEEAEFVSETMKNRYYGIYVKEFVLFYNEELQYYITEELEGEEMVTVSLNKKMDDITSDEGNSKYNAINFMLMARELRDDKTLTIAIENQIQTDYLIDQLFKIK